MATFDYGRMVATASRLIERFGQSAVIRRTTIRNDDGDPFTPDNPVTTDHPCTVVVTDYTWSERAGTLIQMADRKIIVSVMGALLTGGPTLDLDFTTNQGNIDIIAPTVADKIVVGGDVYSIVSLDPLNPGGTLLLWQIQGRR